MPVSQQRLLGVPAGGTIALIRLDCEFALTTDVRQVRGNGAGFGTAAGHFHHDLRCSTDGSSNLFDLGWSESTRRTRTPEAQQMQKRAASVGSRTGLLLIAPTLPGDES
jgi:hypothetical protein